MDRAIHGIVQGRVQGVFYRASLQKQAQALGLAGWVRNLRNGDVEFHAEGNSNAVDRLITWASAGPPRAKVVNLEIRETDSIPNLHGFEVRY